MHTLFKVGFVFTMIAGAAQAQVRVEVGVPSIRWAAPPQLIVVEPGVQVVEDYNEEVFFNNGWYWYRDGGSWYRSQDHRGGWVIVPTQRVPVRLTRLAPGHYRHFKAEKRHEPKRAVKMERRMERGGAPKGAGRHGNGHGKH